MKNSLNNLISGIDDIIDHFPSVENRHLRSRRATIDRDDLYAGVRKSTEDAWNATGKHLDMAMHSFSSVEK